MLYIQASNPIYLKDVDFPNDTSLTDAIECVFPLYTENAYLIWNHISISLSYKYDLSYMIDDIIKLLSEIQEKESGEMIIYWLPDTFRCNWIINWEKEIIKIYGHWECTVGHLEDKLNSDCKIEMSTISFLSEWKKILEIIIKGLDANGFDGNRSKEMRNLSEVYDKIVSFGVLYETDKNVLKN